MWPLTLLLALQTACALWPTTRPNYLKGKEALLQKTWTKEEEKRLKKNFKQNPSQYSQEIGNYTFAKMYQKSPELV